VKTLVSQLGARYDPLFSLSDRAENFTGSRKLNSPSVFWPLTFHAFQSGDINHSTRTNRKPVGTFSISFTKINEVKFLKKAKKVDVFFPEVQTSKFQAKQKI
jgi:hypothetical protein